MKIFPLLSLLVFSLSIYGGGVTASVYLKNGRELEVSELAADSSGNLTFILDGDKYLLPERMWDYVKMPKPGLVESADKMLADKHYREAADVFKVLAEKYKYQGWHTYCQLKRAEALQKINQPSELISLLESAVAEKPRGSEMEINARINMCFMLAEFYVQTGKISEAEALFDEVIGADDDILAAKSYNAKGDILLQRGDDQGAILAYMRPVIMFPHGVKSREYSLAQIVQLLGKNNDKRQSIYLEMLKNEYPDSEHIKKLTKQ
ncbi:MAG: hypothetical protein JXR78_05825 [Victivallales bacterium]|nr:hypothetical protein [Victivallales bacterium]